MGMTGKKFSLGVVVGILVIALIVSCARGEEKKLYKLKFEEGRLYYVRMTTEQNIVRTVKGQEQVIEKTLGFGYNFDVKEVDENGNAWISCTYKWTAMKQKGPGVAIDYDSSKENLLIPPAAQGLAAILDEGFYLKMTPLGVVEKVNGLEAMHSYVKRKIPDGPAKQYIIENLKQGFSEEVVKQAFEKNMAIYPEMAVGVGDSWSKTGLQPQRAGEVSEGKWTLKKCENGIAVFEASLAIKLNMQGESQEKGGGRTISELSGKEEGWVEIKESTGQIIRSKRDQNVSGQVTVEAVDDTVAEKLVIPIKIHNVATFEMTERSE